MVAASVLDPGFGFGINFFRISDPGSGPFFDEILLFYLSEESLYVVFSKMGYS
jgi:hypothetical protein